MPVAETIGVIAGVFNVGSFFLGSGPDAASRFLAAHKQQTSTEIIDSADKNVAFVLEVLEAYGGIMNAVELHELKMAYWNHIVEVKRLRSELEEHAANQVDAPSSKSLGRILRVRNHKRKQKMAKEKVMRAAAEKLLLTSVEYKGFAQTASDKARYKQVLRNERTPVPPSTLSSSTTSATTQSGSTSPTLGALPSANDSIVSFVFDRRPSALSQTVATAGAHAPAAAGPVPQGADTVAIPLERIQTTDTVHSAHTLVSPTPIAAK